MSAPRFYCPEGLAPGAHLKLPDAVSRHAVKALRLQVDAPLRLFNGQGGEYEAVITRIHKDETIVNVGAWIDREAESPCRITLVQALQAADKMDYTLQKAVELGITAIQPVSSRRSVVRLSGEREQKRLQHWQGVVIAACEQCGRNQIPRVAPVLDLLDWLAQPITASTEQSAEKPLRLMLAPGAAQPLSHLPRPTGPLELLIGTEGGLDPAEIKAAQQNGFIPVVLGPRILRTETAGLAALAAIQTLWGDFNESANIRN